jgi:UDP-N-acetylenolpyruvoylglucosamine reductase
MEDKQSRRTLLKFAALIPFALITKPLHAFTENTYILNSNNVTYYKNGDAEYEKLRQGFNKRISKLPAIIALCENTQGVAEAIAYATKNNLPVAIKSGGHCMEGFSCNNGGMVINLSLLNTIEWINNETIKVGPGCMLSDLYATILPKGRIMPGGSCGSVGIGGLTLGGGYGLTARKYGLTCDSLIEVTMVDGKGNIINSNNDPELLWACKGGGNGNFGVITEMKFKTYKAPATMQSFRFRLHKLTTEKVRTLLQKWFEATPKLTPACFSAFVLNGKTAYILLTTTEKISVDVQSFINTLTAATDTTTKTKPQPIQTALKVFYGIQHPVYFKNASAGLYKDFASLENYIDKVIDSVLGTTGMIYQVNTLGGNIQNAELEKASAFPHRAFPYFSELQTYWEVPKQEKRLIERFEAVQKIFTDNGITAQYRNYPDINFKNWPSLYYGSNYARLQAVKRKYDPSNLIRHEQSVNNDGLFG